MPSPYDNFLGGKAPGQPTTPLHPAYQFFGSKKGAAPSIPLLSELAEASQAGDYDPSKPQGSGYSFINSLAYGGRSLSDPGKYIDPMAGGAFDNNAPFLASRFLAEEMRPGGYLSQAHQSRVAARGVRAMFEGGMGEYRRSLNSLGASGLNRRYARGISGGILDRISGGVRSYMTDQEATLQERRFDASKGLIDLMIESANQSKQSYVNYLTAKQAADATEDAGKMSGIGSLIGGALSMFSDARLKKNIITLAPGRPRLVAWEWNEEAAELGLYGNSVGYIAQELREVAPERVTVHDSGYLQITL